MRSQVLDNLDTNGAAPVSERTKRVFARAKADISDRLPEVSPDLIADATSDAVEAQSARAASRAEAAKALEAKRARIEALRAEKARILKAKADKEAARRAAERARLKALADEEAEERRLAEARASEQEARLERELAQEAREDLSEPVRAKIPPLVLGPADAVQAQNPDQADDWDMPEDPEQQETVSDEDLWQAAEAEVEVPQPIEAPSAAATVGAAIAARRSQAPAAPPAPRTQAPAPVAAAELDDDEDGLDPAAWTRLNSFPVNARHLESKRLITAAREDLAHTAFDVLRTRLLQGLRQQGWSRVAITSPSKDCGKTFTAANLALSLARQEGLRVVLLDFDMRRPSVANVFGVDAPGRLGAMLRGDVDPEDHLLTPGENDLDIGQNLAIGFNSKVERYASELLGDKTTSEVLDDIEHRFGADIILFDMPPALYHDDVIAARTLFDGVLLVIGGGITKAAEVKDVERRLGEDTPLLGTVLNFSEGPGITRYSY